MIEETLNELSNVGLWDKILEHGHWAICLVLLVLIIILFLKVPEIPKGIASLIKKKTEEKDAIVELRGLVINRLDGLEANDAKIIHMIQEHEIVSTMNYILNFESGVINGLEKSERMWIDCMSACDRYEKWHNDKVEIDGHIVNGYTMDSVAYLREENKKIRDKIRKKS